MKKDFHEEHQGRKGKKRNPRRNTKDDEGPLRGWRWIERDPPKVGKCCAGDVVELLD